METIRPYSDTLKLIKKTLTSQIKADNEVKDDETSK